MRFHHAVVATLAVCAGSLPAIQAFTQGELLLPSYLCGPAIAKADGTIVGAEKVPKPKALGGVLAGLQEYTYAHSIEVDAGNDFLYDPVNDPMIFLGAMHNAKAAHVSKQFHGPDRRPLPPGGLDTATPVAGNIVTQLGPLTDYNNKTIPITAQTNVLNVLRIPAIPADIPGVNGEPGTPGNMVAPPTTSAVITPNEQVILTLQAKNDVLGAAPNTNVFDPANGGDNALDGAIVYAQNAKNVRVGKFISGGEKAVPWSACGPDNNGIVHAELLSDTNVYNGPTFFLNFDYAWPKNGNPGVSSITFMGAAVSDGGFGFHQTKWQVQPLPDLVLDPNTLNKNDVNRVCMVTQPACVVSCLDCLKKAGSTKNTAVRNNVQVTCSPDMNIGNPLKGQQTIWSFACNIGGTATAVVPPGTFRVNPPAAKDANGIDMPISADDQATLDGLAAAMITPTTDTQQTCNNNNNNNNNNQVNTAATQTHQSWFTTVAVALSAMFAARR